MKVIYIFELQLRQHWETATTTARAYLNNPQLLSMIATIFSGK